MKWIFLSFISFLLSSNTLWGQQIQKVDFKKIKGSITFHPKDKAVTGNVVYTFKMLKDEDSIFLDAKNMKAKLSKGNSRRNKLHLSKNKITVVGNFKANKTYSITLDYKVVNPVKTLYFVGKQEEKDLQIWSQGEGHYTSYWLPSIDDKNDKIVFDLTYSAPKNLTVIGNGKLMATREKETRRVWHYQMQHPMSSYLVAVAIGNFKKEERTSSSGIPLELYYEPQFKNLVEPTYRKSKEIFDFLEQEIGIPFPWKNYKQVPVRDFLYAGMENTTATIFAESLMTDSIGFIDRNFISVNAHELAHQWFGDLITESSSSSHWLQEGFATYYSLLAQRKIFGDDFYYFTLFQNADRLKKRSDQGKGQAVTNPKADALTFYEKGAWAIHMLREQLGDKNFKSGIRKFLQKYSFKNVTTDDFIKVMEEVSGQDLTHFRATWLDQKSFYAKAALTSLRKSKFIQEYLKIAALREQPLSQKYEALNRALSFPINRFIGQEVVNQLATTSKSPQRAELYKKAFNSGNTLVRQAIATSLRKVPETLKSNYETLLKDPSYLTQENALYNLWQSFPQKREKYLDQTKGVQGFYDKNLRMTWLTLALVTPSYHPEKKQGFYEELSGYTLPKYDYSIRQKAFGFLYQIDVFEEQNYRDLMQATVHPVWRFRKFARALLEKLLREPQHSDQLKHLLPGLPKDQQKVLIPLLKQ